MNDNIKSSNIAEIIFRCWRSGYRLPTIREEIKRASGYDLTEYDIQKEFKIVVENHFSKV